MLQKSPMFAYLPVKDVARARAFYEGKLGFVAKGEAGGKMQKPITEGGGAKSAWFRDPEGNILAVIQSV